MVYELRTYDLRPGTMKEFERRFADVVPTLERHGAVWGCWRTELGPLNQFVHIQRYADLEQRAREATPSLESCSDLMLAQSSEILLPAGFMQEDLVLDGGPHVFEMRSYVYKPGSMHEVLRLWSESIEVRIKHSPLVGCWRTELGVLNRLVHIWAYDSLDARTRVRAKATEDPGWPPNTFPWLLSQESKILLPASFSPRR